jgi:integrase
MDRISRDDVKELFANLSAKGLSVNTLKNVLIVLRVILNSAIEDGLVQANAASKMGRFLPADPEKFEPVVLTREEAQLFLEAADVDFQLLLLTLLRTGMRWSEAAAIRWGDIQFGRSEEDQNRFIWVRRNWVQGKFTSLKSKKTRRIDLSRQLRQALLEARDARMLKAYLKGRRTSQMSLSSLLKPVRFWIIATFTPGISSRRSSAPGCATFAFTISATPSRLSCCRTGRAWRMSATSSGIALSRSLWTYTDTSSRGQHCVG